MTHRDTDTYYKDHANQYFSKTSSLDPTIFLRPFAEKLTADDSILDLGCGSGRDLLWLKNKGFQPIGVEKSPELVRLASEHSGCKVIHGDYCSLDFSDVSVKGILFSASLVHLPHDQVADAILNAVKALKHGGYIYVSLKKGQGVKIDRDHRIFYLWEDGDVRMLFYALNLEIQDFQEMLSVRNTGETWLSYCLYYE